MRIFIIARGYPSSDRIYNHGFVHRRVLAYRARGLDVTVIWLHHRPKLDRYIFEGVEVLMRNAADTLDLIARDRPDMVALHAPGDDFAPIIENVERSIPINAWVYGAEMMPFYSVTERAEHNQERFDKAEAVFNRRIAYWRELTERWPPNFRIVFVSEYSARVAEEAVGREIPRKIVSPSPVDTDLFEYIPKPVEQRFKVLLVRPFSDWRYANDLAVEAIGEMSRHSLFDQFHFHIMGDGHLFDEILAPLRHFGNVIAEKRFTDQAEVARLHRQHGLLLCPTRDDAQGVSRDEAMSSGMIPITHAVGPIPEFADPSCAWLAKPETSQGLAEGMLTLGENPDLFLEMSASAARRVRETLAMEIVAERELAIMLR